jgi:flavin-binding protein dodecin
LEVQILSVVKVVELIGSSPESWEAAAQNAINVASKSIRGIPGIDVVHFTAKVKDGKIIEYRANLNVAFIYEK